MTEPAWGAGTPEDAGTIEMTVQGNVMTSSMVPPTVTVNGHEVQTSYGTTAISMPAGHHRIDVHSQWMRRFGQASIELDLAPGQTVPVHYAMPWHQFTTGSIGFEPQKRKGAAFFFTVIGVAAFLAAVIAVLIVI